MLWAAGRCAACGHVAADAGAAASLGASRVARRRMRLWARTASFCAEATHARIVRLQVKTTLRQLDFFCALPKNVDLWIDAMHLELARLQDFAYRVYG